jgi:hypothetical protein
VNGLFGDIHMVGAGGATVSASNDTIYITAGSGGEGGSIAAIQNTDGAITVTNPTGPTTTLNITANAIDSSMIKAGNVTSTDILNGGINTVDFAATAKAPLSTLADSSVKVDTLTFAIATDAQLTTGLATKANTSHAHAGTDITSGTIPVARVDTSTANVGLGTIGDIDRLGATKANTSHAHAATEITSGTLGYQRMASGTPAVNHTIVYNGSSQAWQLLTMAQLPDVEGTATMDALADSVFITYASATASMECQATWLKDNGLYPYGTLTVRPVAGSGFWVISTADEADACRFRYRIGTK